MSGFRQAVHARRFMQVDVFGARPFGGNPVAVVLDADGLAADAMQRIAAWTNLSETTFVLPPSRPEADYRLRIFTPRSELPFAGHPSIGSAHAVLESGLAEPGRTRLVQECGAGLLPLCIEQDAERCLFIQAPAPVLQPLAASARQALAAALGIPGFADAPPLRVEIGPVWLVACLGEAERVRALRPDLAALARLSVELDATGATLFGFQARGDEALYVRSFAPACGVPEDPVCGSGNAGVGAFLAHRGLLERVGERYAAAQGEELGRCGRVHVRVRRDDGAIEIGGTASTLIAGSLHV